MQEKRKSTLINIISAFATLICLVLFLASICFLTFSLCFSKTRVRGYSMRPTINSNVQDPNIDGDIVYINPNVALTRNSIVVANVDWWQKGAVIKRLVGLPGDCVQIEETSSTYDLKVNGELIYSKQKYDNGNLNLSVKNYYRHKYLTFINNNVEIEGEPIDHSANIGEFEGEPCIVIGENEYFLIGDNWSDGMVDSMTYGPTQKQNIVGTVQLIVDVKENSFAKVGKEILKILFSV